MRTRMRNLREDKDMTQAEMGKIFGVCPRTYAYYESEKRNVLPLELLCAVAKFHGVSVDYLLYRTDVKLPYPQAGLRENDDTFKA